MEWLNKNFLIGISFKKKILRKIRVKR